MKKLACLICMVVMMNILLAACGDGSKPTMDSNTQNGAATPNNNTANKEAGSEQQGSKTITYLGKEYKLAHTDRIVIASLEAMEDAAVLGVKPVGTVTDGNMVPSYMATAMEGADDVGGRMQPSAEEILKLKADVILGSSKFQPAVAEQLEKVAPMIPVSHISTNWEANLLLLGEITGKEQQAKDILAKYKSDAQAAKEKLAPVWKDQKVLMVRIRTGNTFVYPANVYFNPSLYADLGAAVPEELNSVKAQEAISLEKLAEINPDYLFVQFAESENKDKPKALEDLQSNPIWSSIKAVKNGKAYINMVDPNAQGGTSWSKLAFLEALASKLKL